LIEILPVSTLPDTNTIVAREAGAGKLKFTAPPVLREERKEKIATLNCNIPCEAGAEKSIPNRDLTCILINNTSIREDISWLTTHAII
jgi:hypothetical protein